MRRRYYGWTLVAALGLITIVAYGTTQYFFGVLLVPVGREQGWSRAELSAAYALALVVSGLLGLPLGRWVDRHGARGVIAVGGTIGGGSLLLLAGVRQLWQWGLLPDGAASAGATASRPDLGLDVRDAARRAAFWTLTATTCIGLAGGTLLFAHQIAYLIGRGEAPQVAAALAGAVGLVSLPGRA